MARVLHSLPMAHAPAVRSSTRCCLSGVATSLSDACRSTLDLTFNKLTDRAVEQLCKALAGAAAADLSQLLLGGNETTEAGRAAATEALRASCPDTVVQWTPRLHKAKPLTTVGLVYKNSPAKRAGLQQGDAVLAWGMLQHGCPLSQRFGFQPEYGNDSMDPFLLACKFDTVLASISPVVRASIGKPIEVVVERASAADAEQTEQLKLTLIPERWSGQGLI
eukprot:2166900-Prymnesium_polylepis.1